MRPKLGGIFALLDILEQKADERAYVQKVSTHQNYKSSARSWLQACCLCTGCFSVCHLLQLE
jgi:hypothetical protein